MAQLVLDGEAERSHPSVRVPLGGGSAPLWVQNLVQQFKYSTEDSDAVEHGDLRPLQNSVMLLSAADLPQHPLEVEGQPFDRHLLTISRLYERSRELFVQRGGGFAPVLLSRHRALTSDSLLEEKIQYTPLARELVWLLSDPERLAFFGQATLKYIKETTTNLFHEQNHRILFADFPAAPQTGPELTRYLNFLEGIAITLDHAQTNETGRAVARVFNALGVMSNNGTDVLVDHSFSRTTYRLYLASYLYVTYLNLQLYKPRLILEEIPLVLNRLLDVPLEVAELAARTAISNVDVGFVRLTNPGWQERHAARAAEMLGSGPPLLLRQDEGDPAVQFALAQSLFTQFGL